MSLINDPGVTGSLLTPRGYIPIAGMDEETHPTKPIEPPVDTTAPTFSDYVYDLVIL